MQMYKRSHILKIVGGAAIGLLLFMLIVSFVGCSSSSDKARVAQLEATIAALTGRTPEAVTSGGQPTSSGDNQSPLNYTFNDPHYEIVLQNAYRSAQNELVVVLHITAKDVEVSGGQVTCCTKAVTTAGAAYSLYGNGPESIRPGGSATFCIGANSGLPEGSVVSALSFSPALVISSSNFDKIVFDFPDIDMRQLTELTITSQADLPAACR